MGYFKILNSSVPLNQLDNATCQSSIFSLTYTIAPHVTLRLANDLNRCHMSHFDWLYLLAGHTCHFGSFLKNLASRHVACQFFFIFPVATWRPLDCDDFL